MICRILKGKVHHSYLRTVAVAHYHIISILLQVYNRRGSCLNKSELLLRRIPKSVTPQCYY